MSVLPHKEPSKDVSGQGCCLQASFEPVKADWDGRRYIEAVGGKQLLGEETVL